MTTGVWFLFLETAVVFGVVLGLHAVRRRTSLVFSYAALAFMTFAAWAAPHQHAISIGPLDFYVESSVFFTVALLGVFILYVADGPKAGQMGLAVVIGTALLYTLLALILQAQFAGPAELPPSIFPSASLRSGSASVFATLVDLVLLGVVWELLQRPARRLPLLVRVFLTLLTVLIADVLVYVPSAWAGAPEFSSMLSGGILSRSVLALLYAPFVTAYFHYEIRNHGLVLAPRPVLSIVTREDLERELVSARHNLRIGAEALWESDERYRRMVDDIPIMVFRFGLDARVTYANDALCKYYGLGAEEVVGESVLKPIERRERDSLWAKVLALTPSTPTVDLTAHAFAKPGERRLQRWRIRGIFSHQGDGLAFQAIGEDITDKHQAEVQLARLNAAAHQAQKMEAVGHLAAGVAHDFNNLLTVIWCSAEGACADLELNGTSAAQEALSALQDIRQSADRAAILTRQLLTLGRQDEVQARPLQLSGLCKNALPLLRRLAGSDISLTVAFDPVPRVVADASQLERVLVNLVVNARDAMPQGGEISLSTSERVLDESYVSTHVNAKPGLHAVLTVSDTGSGIAAATLERIFEPFFTTKGEEQGTGLGLSTAYTIVQQAGGHMRVDSSLNEGTTFEVLLPASEEAEAATSSESSVANGVDGYVLYCENDVTIREAMVTLLESAGYRVECAEDTTTALEIMLSGAPSLLVSDMVIAGGTGIELASRVRQRHPGVPAVLLCGASVDDALRKDAARRREILLPKPFRRQALLSAVKQALT